MALGDFLFPHAEMKLVITRSFETDIESVKGKLTNEYLESAARLGLSKPDFQRLSLAEGKHASVKSKERTVVVIAYIDEKIPEGTAIMPYSPWALALVAVPENGDPPKFHGLDIIVTKSSEEITTLDSLLNS